MRVSSFRNVRKGSVLPLVAVSLIALLGLVALAVDLGMVAVARTQAQAAADLAALTGARTLTGDPATNYNYSAVSSKANTAVEMNNVLNSAVSAGSQMTLTVGSYSYDSTQNKFVIYPSTKSSSDAWSLVQATVTGDQPAYFSRIFGMTTLNASAVATAAARPRDVAVVLDFSGSMRFNSLLGADAALGYLTNRNRSMNPETAYPTFGHYTNVSTVLGLSTKPCQAM